jgi:hypothetical protein
MKFKMPNKKTSIEEGIHSWGISKVIIILIACRLLGLRNKLNLIGFVLVIKVSSE